MKKKHRFLPLVLALCMGISGMTPISVEAKGKDKGTVIDVTDYGAEADNGKDNAEAIIKAVAAAKKASDAGENVTISFPKGRYDIYPDKIKARELYISNTVGTDQNNKMKKIGILLEDMKNVTVEGNDSLFMFHGKMTTFAAINCQNVTFQNFEVDFQTPTVVDVTVEKTEGNTATVYVPECYNYEIKGTSVNWISDKSPYTNQPYWTTTNNMVYTQRFDTKTGLTWRGNTTSNPLFQNVKTIEDMGNNRLKFTYNSGLNSELRPGLCYQMRPTVRDHAGTFFWKSKNVALKHLDISFLHGFGMVGQHSDTLTLDDVDFEAPLESGRTTAGYADFIQMSGCKGKIDISNCTFSNPHDDPINVHGTFNQVVEVINNKTFKVRFMHNETAGFPNFFVGDTVEFTKMSTLLPVENSTAKVVKVDGPDGEGGKGSSNSLTDIIVTLDKEIPGIQANQHAIENITYTPEVHIHDNVFKETPTRGILVTTRKPVLIENNTFDGMGMSSIFISNDAQNWRESGRTENVTIKNNVFTRGKDNAIFVEPTNPNGSAQAIHKNMTIEGNTFYMEDKHVLNAKSVDNLTFKNNKIYRQEPNATVNVTVDGTTMKVGETKELKATTTSTQLNTRAYKFRGCYNVTIEGNTYDAGVNAGSLLSDNTKESDITVKNDIVQLNKDNKTDLGQVYYQSSDEKVATVTDNGVVRAVKEGTVTITPYLVAGERKFPGTPITLTVSGKSDVTMPTEITISSDKETTDGANVQYTSSVKDSTVTWSVVDAKTGKATDKATISNTGLLTPKASGVVEVVAKTVNGLEARKLLSIQMNGLTLGNGFTIDSEQKDGWSIPAENKIEIKALKGGLWNTQTMHNLFGYKVDNAENVEATIKMEGLTQSNWDEAGLIFFKDGDHYVSIERKHGNNSPKIKLVNEPDRNSPSEVGESNVTENTVWFKLKKAGDKVTGSYSKDGANWTDVSTVTNANLGNSFKIGMLAGTGSNSSNAKFTFSELKVDNKTVNLTANVKDSLPTATANVTYKQAENKVEVSHELTGATEAVVKWAVADTEGGNYSVVAGAEGKTLTTTRAMKNKYVKAAVVPVTASGISGNIVWSNAVQVTGEGQDVDISKMKSSNALLKTAEVDGLQTPFETFNPKTYHYYTTAGIDERAITANFAAEDENAKVEVLFNGKKVEATSDLTLHSARNLIEVNVTAEDGITTNHYRFTVSRTGENITGLSSLSINEDTIALQDNVYTYKYALEKEGKITVKATPKSQNAKVTITVNGKVAKEGKADAKPGTNTVNILVSSETSAAPAVYTVFVKVPDSNNANLEEMTFSDNVQLNEVFDKNTVEYTGLASEPNTAITVVAEEKDAKVEVMAGGKVIGEGEGKVYTAHTLAEGENTLKVKVTSPNGKETKTYTVDLKGTGTVYLSDMNWESQTSGDAGSNPTRKDKSCGGNAIKLWNGTEEQTFKKGLGSHAKSEIVYDLEGKGYETFESYAGVDREAYKDTHEADITFKVYVDGVEKATSAVMKDNTAMHHFKVDIKGAKKLKLVMEPGTHNWSDHGDWADAKVLKPFETKETFTLTTRVNDEKMGTAVMDNENGVYGKNTLATLTAKANDGYEFVNWTDADGNVLSKAEVYKYVVTKNEELQANFKKSDMEGLNEVPVIHAEDKTLTVGDEFDPLADVTATDKEDGSITLTTDNVIKNEVDTTKAGVYEVVYKVTDSQGASVTKTITVTVNPKTEGLNEVPVIHAEDKTLTVGDEFDPLEDVTATDKEDGSITLTTDNVIKNEVDTTKAGVYEVVYKVTDSQGASVTKTITVTVKEKSTDKPVKPNKPNKPDVPKTGDMTNFGLLASMLAGSLAILAVMVMERRKKKENN